MIQKQELTEKEIIQKFKEAYSKKAETRKKEEQELFGGVSRTPLAPKVESFKRFCNNIPIYYMGSNDELTDAWLINNIVEFSVGTSSRRQIYEKLDNMNCCKFWDKACR